VVKGILRWLFGPGVDSISVAEAYETHFQDERPTVILDVRQPVEHRSGTIPGAEFIPITELGSRLNELPRDHTILTICRSGHRSPIAARRLRKAGFDVLDVSGGMLAWQKEGLPVE
jgi:rhodanese-related sulfurtransferase